MLAVVLAMVGGLVGLGAATGTPHAAACEESKPECRPDEHGPSVLTVSGTIVFGTAVITIQARSENGEASGQVVVPTATEQGGPVLDLVARGDDEYCVLIDVPNNTPPGRIAYFVRDVGDGLTTFDQYTSFGSNAPITCDTYDPQPSDFSTVSAGNITVVREAGA